MTLERRLPFTKMHSLGNDFVMLNGIDESIDLSAEQARQIADRHYGVGCDQIILVQPADGEADFLMRVFNTDGSESGQCGNGARCLGEFLRDQGLTSRESVHIQTQSTQFELKMQEKGVVSAALAAPNFEPRDIPLIAQTQEDYYDLKIKDQSFRVGAVSMGNPHAVILVDDVSIAPVAEIGSAIECHAAFPENANVGFLEIAGRDQLRLRVWERGVGETLACGSGACAAVAVAHRWGRIEASVTVTLPGGRLALSWPGSGPVWMTGPTTTVFQGVWDLD